MNRVIALLLFCAICCCAPLVAHAVTIDWAIVGDPGNSPDPIVMNDGTTGYGDVAYTYKIAKHDVTNSQYVEFLNAKDPTGANILQLFGQTMRNNDLYTGIQFSSANPNGTKYGVVSDSANHPVNFVSFYSALRFTNWLNNGQGDGDTESGSYTLLGAKATPTNAGSIARSASANIVIPNEDEWHKAAYYNPNSESYFLYPTSSDNAPTPTSPTAVPNSANFGVLGYLTDVGAYSGTMSPYGAFDMGGNVEQWTETLVGSSTNYFRATRGGTAASTSWSLLSSHRNIAASKVESGHFRGFRVATIPEPSTLMLVATGVTALVGIAAARRRRR